MNTVEPLLGNLSAMSKRDALILLEETANSQRYLEFGCGDSTKLVVAQGSIRQARSVESDPAYAEHIANDVDVKAALFSGLLKFINVDIGPVGAWGMPINREREIFWPNYFLSPFADGFSADVVLVDGRFRVACSLAAICAQKNARILVHDYSWRPEYHVLEKLLKLVRVGDTLAVFRLGDDVDRRRILNSLRFYAYAPDDFPTSISSFLRKLRVKVERRCGKKLFATFEAK